MQKEKKREEGTKGDSMQEAGHKELHDDGGEVA